MIKKAYVVGNNTSKSLSPIIFDYWFKKYQINGKYNYIEIKENNFNKEIKHILLKKDLCGINITIPYKERVTSFLSEIDTHSQTIGAINCITKKELTTVGSNTDWLGVLGSIKSWEKKQIDKSQKKNIATVLGFGGSAKAAIYALQYIGYKKIKVFNRSFDKIKTLKGRIFPYELNDFINHTKEVDIVINTLPIRGYYEKIDSTNFFKNKTVGLDLAYTTKTGFLELFSDFNRINGLNMLVHQAAPCFEKWFNILPEIDNMLLATLNEKIKNIL
tara:strand:+ start:437 stop:1258 length:822 start_codon:yes stop_codon:yes gene_type:complete